MEQKDAQDLFDLLMFKGAIAIKVPRGFISQLHKEMRNIGTNMIGAFPQALEQIKKRSYKKRKALIDRILLRHYQGWDHYFLDPKRGIEEIETTDYNKFCKWRQNALNPPS